MRSTIVGGPRSKLHGAKCRLCPHPVGEGEAVLYDVLETYGYVDNRYVMHVECIQATAERVRPGRPVRAVPAQARAIRERAIRIAKAAAA